MIRNLVIGSEGYVGGPLCAYLESRGERVVRFDIKRGEGEDARRDILPLHDVDRVYFLAWDVGGAKYLYRDDTQLSQMDWNLRLMLNVMGQLRATYRPFVFVSSQLAEMYDTVYGVTKRLGEIWTHLLGGVRLRLWNVYGPIESGGERSHALSDFVTQAVTQGRIRMLTSGEERRQLVHIDDVCAALHLGMASGLQGVYDVTSFEWLRIIDVARAIADLTGAELIPGERTGTTPLTPMQGRLPGWLPRVSLEHGLKRMVEIVRQRRS